MHVLNEIKAIAGEFVKIRQDIHAHPELSFQETHTSNLIATLLQDWGIEVHRNVGKTGVVGVLHGQLDAGPTPRSIGIRADIDALPIVELNDLQYTSKINGCMHACGHDGHTATLLCAAKYLSQHRDFAGIVNFIFQPAEELPPGGARAMIEDDFFNRFPCDEIYALHTEPNLPVGKVAFTKGAGFASANAFTINIKGKGGHAAMPHLAIDPIIIAAEMIMALQTIVSRNINPDESALLSITQVHAGSANNIIPNEAMLNGTIRTFNMDLVEQIENDMRRIVETLPQMHGGNGQLEFVRGYPVLMNWEEPYENATRVALNVLGKDNVIKNGKRHTGSEDFAYFLQKAPGVLFLLGNNSSDEKAPGLHNPYFNFNDDAIPIGATLWVELVKDFFARS